MGRPLTARGKFAQQILREFPKASSTSLAGALIKRHPLIYIDQEDARNAIRYFRGASGGSRRHKSTVSPSPFSKLLCKIPKAYSLRDTSPYAINGCEKLVVFGDLHIPYHWTPAIHAMLEHLCVNTPDGLLINGDLMDCHKESTFEQDPNAREFVEESDAVVQFLELLRELFPKMDIWYKLGNHEERHERFLWAKCPEIYGHPNFRLESILELERLGIKVIRDKRRVSFGKLSILHGHEYRSTIGRPVNPARWLLLKAKANVLANHFHGEFRDSQRTISGDDLGAWTNGCLCNLEPHYAPFNEWCHSFSIVHKTSKDGDFRVEQKRISAMGKVY